MKKSSSILAVLFYLVSSLAELHAENKYWDGSDGSWTVGDWRATSPTGPSTTVPGSGDNPYINSGRVTVAGGDSGAFGTLRIGTVAGGSGTLSVDGLLGGSAMNIGGSGTGTLIVGATGIVTLSSGYGVWLDGGGAVVNFGAITSAATSGGATIYANSANTIIKNEITGLIRATHTYSDAISLAGGTVTNSGTILSVYQHGINIGSGYVQIDNTGLIQGNQKGINFANSSAISTITNSGTIIGTAQYNGMTGYGIATSSFGTVDIVNEAVGLIQGYHRGISVNGGGAIANSGTIIGRTEHGIEVGSISIPIDNRAGALIQGGLTGIILYNGGGAITNAGMIVGNSQQGIDVRANPAKIDNAVTGLIQGGNIGIYLAAGGTVANSGTVSGTSSTSRGVYAGASALVENTAAATLITGGNYGVQLAAGGTVTNLGTISGTASGGRGVSANVSVLVENIAATALITGGNHGIWLESGGTVTNLGTISGGMDGVSANGSALVENIAATALIQGDNHGIFLFDGGTVTNLGTISGTASGGSGVSANGSALVKNTAVGALITGGGYGVQLGTGGTVTNVGTISGTSSGGSGVSAYGSALVANTDTGLIQGGNYGIYLDAGGTVTNSGTITGATMTIYSASANTLVKNETTGLIQGTNDSVRLGVGGTVVNFGTIISVYYNGVYAGNIHGYTQVDNTGLIQANQAGINLQHGGAITNSGTIIGTSQYNGWDGYGIVTSSFEAADIMNEATGLIQGYTRGINLNAGGGAITNSGTIIGQTVLGISVSSTSAPIDNRAGALIQGGLIGIILYSGGGPISNSGIIIGDSEQGIIVNSSPVKIDNKAAGLIQGATEGIYLQAGGTITNSGSIIATSAASSNGIYSSSNNVLVENKATGLIEGGYYGVFLERGGTVTNSGAINGTARNGISTNSNFTANIINNATGLIQGGVEGVFLYLGGTVSNSGTIIGQTDDGIYAFAFTDISNTGLIQGSYSGIESTAGGRVDNMGVITGGMGILFAGSAASTLINSGTVNGSVFFNANAANDVRLHIGGKIDGLLSIAGNTSKLTLAGDNGVQVYSAAVTDATTFSGTLVKQDAGTWVLDRNQTSALTGVTLITGGTLRLANLRGAGAGNITNDASLDLAASGTFSNNLAGTGTVTVANAVNINYTGAAGSWAGITNIGDNNAFRVSTLYGDASSLINVNATGTLGGTGTIGGSVVANNQGHLAPGNADTQTGLLTVLGDLVLNDGAILDYRLGKADVPDARDPANDLIDVIGDLTLSGTSYLNITAQTGFGLGVYRLINYDGALNLLNGGTIAFGALTGAGAGMLTTGDFIVDLSQNHQVNFVGNAGDFVFWDGANPALWDSGTIDGGAGTWTALATDRQWTDASGGLNGRWDQDKFAIFGYGADALPGDIVTVDNADGDIRLSGAQFIIDGYTLDSGALTLTSTTGTATFIVGDGSLDDAAKTATISSTLIGTTVLKKEGAGTLVLAGTNTYTGTTTIKAGVLAITNGEALSTGAVGIDSIATLELAFTTSDTLANRLQGTGTLSKTGAGVATLTHGSSSVGAVDVRAGTLEIDPGSPGLFRAAGNYTTRAGAATTIAQSATLAVDGGIFKQEAGSALNVTVTSVGTTAPIITAQVAVLSGTLELADSYSPEVSGSASGLADALTTIIRTGDGVTFNFEAITGGPDTGLDYVSFLRGVSENGKDYNIGYKLTWLTGTATASGAFTIDAGKTFTLDQVLHNQNGAFATGWDGKSLTKQGDGTLVITVPQLFTGTTNVASGTLQLNAANAIADSANVNVTGLLTTSAAQQLNNLTGTGTVSFSQNLNLNSQVATTFGGQLTGAGAVAKTGAATLTLSGSSDYTGGTRIAEGDIAITDAHALGAGAVDIASASSSLLASFSGTFGNTLAGAGSLEVLSGRATLTAATSAIGAVDVSGGALVLAQAGAFTVAGDHITRGGAATELAASATLAVGGVFTQQAGSTLTLAVSGSGPKVTAASAQLSGTLNVSGYNPVSSGSASGLASTWTTLISTTGGISGDFADKNGVAASGVDYIATKLGVTSDGLDYVLGRYLAWFDGPVKGHGTFTLTNPADTFILDLALSDTTTGSDRSWDGRSLTKQGEGTLVITVPQLFTGTTNVASGTLQLDAPGAIAASANVRIDGVLASATTQQLNNLTGSGTATNSSFFILHSTLDTACAGVLAGTGSVAKTGAATLTLTGSSDYEGGTRIDEGTLKLENVHATGTGLVTVNADASLELAAAGTYANQLAGAGELAKTGAMTTTLIGTTSTIGAVNVAAGTLVLAQQGAFATTGDYTTRGGATTTIAPSSTLAVGGVFAQEANSTLAVSVTGTTPMITADTAQLGGTLEVSGYTFDPNTTGSASALGSSHATLLATGNGIGGDFDRVTGVIASTVDYITSYAGKANNDHDYVLGYRLSWMAAGTAAHGGFTIAGGTSFTLDIALSDTTPNPAKDWDGRSLTKKGAGMLIISASQAYTGTTNVASGTLQLDAPNAIASSTAVVLDGVLATTTTQTLQNLSGSGTATNSSFFILHSTLDTAYAGVLDGTGSVAKTGAATLTLSGGSDYSGGTQIQSGTLVSQNASALGSGTVAIDSALVLDYTGDYANDTAGAGLAAVAPGASVALTGNNAGFSGTWAIAGAASATTQDNLGAAGTNITGRLTVSAANWDYTNTLTGNGTLVADLAPSTGALSFAATAGSAFTGTVDLVSGWIDLKGANAAALTNATLKLGANGSSFIDSNQAIGALAFAGGIYEVNMLNNHITGTLTVGTLDVSTYGTVRITGPYTIDPDQLPAALSFFDQDDGGVLQRIIVAGAVVSTAGTQIAITDKDGNSLNPTAVVAESVLDDSGGQLGDAYYDFFGKVSDEAATRGIYLTYGLVRLDAFDGKTIVLSNSTAADSALGARLTGTGGFTFSGTGVMDVGNALSDYTGATTLATGTVRALTGNALGKTARLALAASTALDLNRQAQTIGELDSQAGSTVNLNSGTLAITAGGTSAGALTGAGLLNTAGTLDIIGPNTGLQANIVNTGTIHTDDTAGLGNAGTLTNNAGLFQLDAATGTLFKILAGNGGTELRGSATVTLAGANDAYTGAFAIGAGSRLIATTDAHLGEGNLTGEGVFEKQDPATTITLAHANNGFSGTTLVTAGTLALRDLDAVGSSQIENNASLALGASGTFENNITGSGTTYVSYGSYPSHVVLTGANQTDWIIGASGRAVVSSTTNLGAGSTHIDGRLDLAATSSASWLYTNALTGAGTLYVNLATPADAFAFDPSAGSLFRGTVELANSTFALDAAQAAVLADATLQLDAGNHTRVTGAGVLGIGNLTFNGGRMDFDITLPADQAPAALVSTGTLDLNAGGTIAVNLPAGGDADLVNQLPLLQQDDTRDGVRLIAAQDVRGNTNAMVLTDTNGARVADPQTVAINQSGTKVADGTYDYRLDINGAAGAGLYVGYQLTAVDILDGKTLVLASDTTAPNLGDEFHAAISGPGSLRIDATSAITLNAANTHTGTTLVATGTLVSGVSRALGDTAELNLAAGTTYDLNGKYEAIGKLDARAASLLDMNSGTLAITAGGTSAGALTGAGLLNTAGTLDIIGPNTGLQANIVNTGTIHTDDTAGLGNSGTLTNNAGLFQLDAATGTLFKILAGNGGTELRGSATVTLAGANDAYTGTFAITAGSRLIASDDAHLGDANLTGQGVFEKQDPATTITLTHANDGFSGTTLVTAGTLALRDLDAVGTSQIENNAALVLGASGEFDNNTRGTGTTWVTAATVAITGTNTQAAWNITGAGHATVSSTTNLGAGSTHIDGRLDLDTAANTPWLYTNLLTGSGTLLVDLKSGVFDFDTSAGANFQGTVQLADAAYNLAPGAANEAALAHATLQLDGPSILNLGANTASGTMRIHGLALNGGAVNVQMRTADTAHVLTVDTLLVDLANAADTTFNVDAASLAGGQVTERNFLDQDDVTQGLQLIAAQTIDLAGKQMKLEVSGTAVPSTLPVTLTVSDGVNTDIEATYDYMAVSATNNAYNQGAGVYADYVLTTLKTSTGLIIDTGSPVAATDNNLGAAIIGTGSVSFNASGGLITLNGANTYEGATDILSGTVRADVDDALGQTSLLNTLDGAALDLNGKAQTIGALDNKGTVAINSGTLTIANGGASTGALAGAGELILDHGTLRILASNTDLSATTTIRAGATAILSRADGLGTGGIVDDGILQLDTAVNGVFANALSGAGWLHKTGSGTVGVTHVNSAFTGSSAIDSGRLVATNLHALGKDTQVAVAAAGVYEQSAVSGTHANTVSGAGAWDITNGSALEVPNNNPVATVNIRDSLAILNHVTALGGTAATVNLNAGAAILLGVNRVQLGTLNMNNGALAFENGRHVATIETLGASTGNFILKADLAAARAGINAPGAVANALTIGSATGAHEVHVVPDGEPAARNIAIEMVATGAGGTATFHLAGGMIECGITAFELLQGDNSQYTPDTNKWYLTDRSLSHAADAILNTAANFGDHSLDALYLRLGEVRAENLGAPGTSPANDRPSTGNLWVRTRGYRLNVANTLTNFAYRQYGWGVSLGADKAFPTEKGVNMLGGFVDMGREERQFDNHGNGSTSDIAIGATLTVLRRDGWFADLVAKLGRQSNAFEARAYDGKTTRGRYTNHTQTLSAEAGRRLGRADGWWVEPAAQMSLHWMNGADYMTQAGQVRAMRVQVGDSMSLQTRALVRAGYRAKGGKWHPYGKIGVAALDTDGGEITAHGKRLDHDHDGKRAEFGLGAMYRIDAISQVYLDYEYAKAPTYERPWSLNLGYSRLW